MISSRSAAGARPHASSVVPWTAQVRLLGQLVLAGVIVYQFRIEGTPLLYVMLLATAGFAASLWFPAARTHAFFAGLSMIAALLVFGLADGAWLIAASLLLIGCCYLPIATPSRVAVIVTVGTAMAFARSGNIPTPWSAVIWPILGSMFMFRLVLFMRATDVRKAQPGLTGTLAYFFQLPNLVFPLYPVIDYQTFLKTYFDKPATEIYEQGLLWIVRGLAHLLLYRLIYLHVVTDPADVTSLGDLVQYMLGTFLLYLRVSGQFHLIVGLLHLFGYRLPETHHLYYLSHNFTELWRRINIYWKDFMLQVVFYPAYFRLKNLGPARAIAISTAAVFAATWLLHSYQWFWLRGGFPLTWPDFLFWAILGALVVVGALRESRAGPRARNRVGGWSLRNGLRIAATFSFFCFLWSLWSTETLGQWLWMLSAAGEVDLKGVVLLAAALLGLILLGGKNWDAASPQTPRWVAVMTSQRARTNGTLVLLLLAGLPLTHANLPQPVAAVLASLKEDRLNARDAALQHRGYYEQLEVRERVDGTGGRAAARPPGWQDVGSMGVIRETQDALTRDLYASRHVIWNGNAFTTNRWGMRDKDYALDKPETTLRIALLGPSHVMGNGVGDGETFEALLENRLNREFTLSGIERFEILNFGVDGYTLTQQVALLEDRVFDFKPDMVIATHYHQNRTMTETYMLKLLQRGARPPDEQVAELMKSAGLSELDRTGVPIPFARLRRWADSAGLDVRMPSAELQSRIHGISGAVLTAAFQRLADVTRDRNVEAVVLLLDDVLDGAGTDLAADEGIRISGLPVINLLDVYPEEERPMLRLGPWDNHPNAAGHRLIAQRLYPELSAFLEGFSDSR